MKEKIGITKNDDKVTVHIYDKEINPIALTESCFQKQPYFFNVMPTYSKESDNYIITLTLATDQKDKTIEEIFSKISIQGQPTTNYIKSWLDSGLSTLSQPILNYALFNDEVKNDPQKQESILKLLSKDYKFDLSSVYPNPSLTSGSIEVLLNLGLSPQNVLQFAFYTSEIQADPQKQENILKLLKNYKVDPSDYSLYYPTISLGSLSTLLDLGFDPQKILDFGLYDPEIQQNPQKQESLLELLIKNPTGYKLNMPFSSFFNTENGANITEKSISIMFELGLDSKEVLDAALSMFISSNEFELQERQKLFAKLAINKGASLETAKHIQLPSMEFVDFLVNECKVDPKALLHLLNSRCWLRKPIPITKEEAEQFQSVDVSDQPEVIESNKKLQQLKIYLRGLIEPDKDTAISDLLELVYEENYYNDDEKQSYYEHNEGRINKLIKFIKENQLNINPIFEERIPGTVIFNDIELTPSAELLIILTNEGLLDPSILLIAAIKLSDLNLLTLAIEKNANIHYRPSDKHLLELALELSMPEVILSLKKYYTDLGDNNFTKSIIMFMERFPFSESVKIIQAFGAVNEQQFADELKETGISESIIKGLFEYYNFLLGYSSDKVSDVERKILESNEEIELAEIREAEKPLNEFGYTMAQLLLLTGNINKLIDLLKAAPEFLHDINNNGTTFLQLLYVKADSLSHDNKHTLVDTVLSNIKDIDQLISGNVTLIDALLNLNPKDIPDLIKRSNDPLFHFMKEGVSFSPDDGRAHIGIICPENISSQELYYSRLMKEKYGVECHLITPGVSINVELLSKCHGFINFNSDYPYPNNKDEFTLTDYESFDSTKLCQEILAISKKYSIPYCGIDTGARELTLYHEGSLKLLKTSSNKKQDEIIFIKGTIPYFMALAPDQQESIIAKKGHLQDIKYNIPHEQDDLVAAKIGSLILGAISDDGLPRAYSKGLQFGFQYSSSFNDIIPIINSFIKFTKLNLNHQIDPHNISLLEYLTLADNSMEALININPLGNIHLEEDV